MRHEELELLVCPISRKPLALEKSQQIGDDIVSGILRAQAGTSFRITNGIPDLTYPEHLADRDDHARTFYDGRADAYDEYLYLTFKTHGEDEAAVRKGFVDTLNLHPKSRVLEIACGTGRDSEQIANRLGSEGSLCVQDISPRMLERCRQRLATAPVPTCFSVSNACYLPFPDSTFDAVFSFGGLGEFSDIRRCLSEMVRVSRVGARIVVGDESIPPWLRHTVFAKILTTTNKQFLAPLPLEAIPVEARDVRLRWVIGGVFYLIDFIVGEGEPAGDFDFQIPGVRGGTLRTRYEGQLEGVTREAKDLAERARARRGVSMHAWLDSAVRDMAARDLAD